MDGRQAQERRETAGRDYEHQADVVDIRSRIMNKYRRDFLRCRSDSEGCEPQSVMRTFLSSSLVALSFSRRLRSIFLMCSARSLGGRIRGGDRRGQDGMGEDRRRGEERG